MHFVRKLDPLQSSDWQASPTYKEKIYEQRLMWRDCRTTLVAQAQSVRATKEQGDPFKN
jgi:hypothetical protein